MRMNFLKYKTRSFLKSNHTLRTSLPFSQAHTVGVIFTVEDKSKHEEVKDFVKKLEQMGKHVKVLCFLPKNKDNYEFLYDYYTEKDINFWGSLTSDTALKFSEMSFDFLFYLDSTPNPFVLNILARSKAHCRAGRFFESGEKYLEFMMQVPEGIRQLMDALYNYTIKLR